MRVRMALVPIPDFDEPIFQLNDEDFAACMQPGMVIPASMPHDGPQPLSTAARKRKRYYELQIDVRMAVKAIMTNVILFITIYFNLAALGSHTRTWWA